MFAWKAKVSTVIDFMTKHPAEREQTMDNNTCL